jgi:predicted NACHT family NTPase
MMLMTFDQFADVPSKMRVFYNQCFEVLFSKHDATKASFRRQFLTDLQIDDFRRVLSTFCMLTLLQKKIQIPEDKIEAHAEEAIRFERMDVKPRALVKDFSESASVMLHDGRFYSFIHRSFQEYFTAVFIAERQHEMIPQIIDHFIHDLDATSVIALLHEMNPTALEETYLRPQLKKLRKRMSGIDIKNGQLMR